jgi:hypothetical protein
MLLLIALVQNHLNRIPSKRTESHNFQRPHVPLYYILMALPGARTPYLNSFRREEVWESSLRWDLLR